MIFNVLYYMYLLVKAYYQIISPTYKKLYTKEMTEKLYSENAQFLEIFDSISLENPKNLVYLFFQAFYDTIGPLIIVFGAATPFTQVVPIVIINVAILGYMIYLAPFKTRMDNIVAWVNSGVVTAVFFVLMMLHMLQNVVSETVKFLLFGNLLILIISISVLFNLGIGIWTTGVGLWELFQQIKEDRKESSNDD